MGGGGGGEVLRRAGAPIRCEVPRVNCGGGAVCGAWGGLIDGGRWEDQGFDERWG